MNFTGSRPLKSDEIAAITDAGMAGRRHRSRDLALISLGVRTGFRVSELLSLRVVDVFDGTEMRSQVTVKRAWMKGKRRGRTMPLHAEASRFLREYLRDTSLENSPESPLFPAQGRGKSLSRQMVHRILRQAAARAGVDQSRVGTHSMRKSFAAACWVSPLIQRDISAMARLLGHQSVQNTLTYLECVDLDLTAAVMAL